MDDGEMKAAVASSDDSREKIEKKERKGRKGGKLAADGGGGVC